MTLPTQRIEPGQDLAAAIAAGGEVVLAPGVHRGGLFIEASVRLVGEPGAVLDAGGRGPVLFIAADDLEVQVRSLRLTGGHSELGAGVKLTGWSRLSLVGCEVEGYRSAQGGAAGLGQSAGELVLEDCRFGAGDGLLLTGLAEARLVGCALLGACHVREGASATLSGGRVAELWLRGTSTRQPSVVSDGAEIGVIHNDAAHPGRVG